MVSPTSRWTATPLLILLLSSTTYAQYTLRGRVVQDHHKHSLDRRAAPAARPSDSGADESAAGGDDANPSEAGGDDSENPAGPAASSSTQSDKDDEGDAAPGDGVSAGSDKAPAPASESHDGGGGNNALYLASHEDFCVYGPSEANTPINSVGDNVVSWCTKDHGSKTIPEGTLSGVTYVKTPNYVQVSGYGDFTKINIAAGDKGGQFDSSVHTPSGAQLLLGADKSPASNWVTLIGFDTFCVRACTGDPQYCPTQYDTEGCYFLTNDGVGWPNEFQDCEGEDGNVPGVFDGKTYTVGQGTYPPLVAPSVNCNGGAAGGPAPTGTDHKSAGAHESGNSSAHGSSGSSGPSGSGSASSSEEWLPVETCVPCAGAGAGAGAASSGGPSSGAASSGPASAKPSSSGAATPALSGTTEVGMSQLQTGGSLAGGASAIAGSPTTAPKPGGDALVQKRQAKSSAGGESDAGSDGGDEGASSPEEGGEKSEDGGEESEGGGEKTVTKGDQCCFTTWTQAGGGAKPTGTGTATGTGAGAGNSGATSAPFSGMSVAAPSASKAVNGSGVAGAGNKTAGATNGTGNGTGNGTESGAESWRGEAFGMDGMSKIVGGLIIGLIGGGWSLV